MKPSWFIVSKDESDTTRFVGECGLLPGLSPDDVHEYENVLDQLVKGINGEGEIPDLTEWPSIRFGYEIFQAHRESKDFTKIFPGTFSSGKKIQINGLIWMGTKEKMLNQLAEKIEDGFSCIKIKIGAIDFDEELYLLKSLRKEFSSSIIEIRVDANGAFSVENAREKLDRLSEFDIHSIEQPIKQGQTNDLAKLCESSPIPIALDEELIGKFQPKEKADLLNRVSF